MCACMCACAFACVCVQMIVFIYTCACLCLCVTFCMILQTRQPCPCHIARRKLVHDVIWEKSNRVDFLILSTMPDVLVCDLFAIRFILVFFTVFNRCHLESEQRYKAFLSLDTASLFIFHFIYCVYIGIRLCRRKSNESCRNNMP